MPKQQYVKDEGLFFKFLTKQVEELVEDYFSELQLDDSLLLAFTFLRYQEYLVAIHRLLSFSGFQDMEVFPGVRKNYTRSQKLLVFHLTRVENLK